MEDLFYKQVKSHPAAKNYIGITSFSFHQAAPRLIEMKAVIHHKEYILKIPTDGRRILNEVPSYYKSLVLLSGYWKADNKFVVTALD